MTPEELNRTIEFIVESQARLAAAQEQDRHDRFEFERLSNKHFDKLDRVAERLARLAERQTQLLNHQSERMDWLDKLYADWRVQNEDFHKQTLHLLNLILDRLPPRPAS